MIEAVGHLTLQKVGDALSLLGLFWDTFRGVGSQVVFFRFRWRQTILQTYAMALESLPVIGFALTFISLMLILEFSFHMKLILHQDSLVPSFSTMLMIREMGPVVTALLLASRVGAAIAAEIGSMKITEQLDALRLLAVDPVEYLVIPRWVASVFAAVSLTVVSVSIALVGGASIATVKMGYTYGQFLHSMFVFTHFSDLVGAMIKAAVFGTIIPIVASHHGFRCRAGAEGVGDAATSAVVDSSIMIIMADFVLTYLLYAV